MADVPVPSIATATPDGDDTVLGVKDGLVKRFSLDNVGAGINFSAVNATTNMVFNTNGTEKMRLDSAGNLGLGVTPSAWSSNQRSLQIRDSGGFTGAFYAGFGAVGVGSNNFYGGGASSTYIATGFASKYEQISGQHQWFNAPSGTAGNAVTFTQAMTLDNSGNLGVGTSSPSSTAGFTTFTLNNASSGGIIDFQNNGSLVGRIYNNSTNFHVYNQTANALVLGTGGTERARIDSYGNLIQTVNTTAATLTTNNTLTFSIVDNSTLRISVRGSDGTTRTATVALT